MTDVFSHNLSDAWGISEVSVRVRDTEKHNVICSDGETKIKYTIPSNAVDEIREIIKNSNLLELNDFDLDFPPVLDGTMDRFVFSDGSKTNDLFSANLWYYQEHVPEKEKNELFTIFMRISEILLANGVDKRYLRLK